MAFKLAKVLGNSHATHESGLALYCSRSLPALASLASPAPSLEEEGSGALPVHELFFSPGFLGNMNIHEIRRAVPQLNALPKPHACLAVRGSVATYTTRS